jgi:hypothetical protein
VNGARSGAGRNSKILPEGVKLKSRNRIVLNASNRLIGRKNSLASRRTRSCMNASPLVVAFHLQSQRADAYTHVSPSLTSETKREHIRWAAPAPAKSADAPSLR